MTIQYAIVNKPKALEVLTNIISGFSDDQKANLKSNIDNNKQILCHKRAYLFCDANAGCLLTLSLTTDLPDDPYDFKKNQEITLLVSPRYNELIKQYGLDYYHATQTLEESEIKELIIKLC